MTLSFFANIYACFFQLGICQGDRLFDLETDINRFAPMETVSSFSFFSTSQQKISRKEILVWHVRCVKITLHLMFVSFLGIVNTPWESKLNSTIRR